MNEKFCHCKRIRLLETGTSKPIYRKQADIIIKTANMHYRVSNLAYIEAQSMEAAPQRMTDICEDGNIDRVDDVMRTAVHEVYDLLLPYSKSVTGCDNTADDNEHTSGGWNILLHLPDDFPEAEVDGIGTQAVEYISSRILKDWCALVKPESMPLWNERMQEAKENLSRALMKRCRRVRRTMSTF